MNLIKQASLAVSVTAALATTTQAALFNWNQPSGGNFNTAGNWTPGGGPPNDVLDVALFNLNASYTVQFTENLINHSVDVGDGTVSLNLWLPGIPLSFPRHYNLNSPSTALNVSSASTDPTPAKLIISGRERDGDRSSLETVGTTYIGFAENEKGDIDIIGTHYDFADALIVGNSGQGTLYIDHNSRIFGVGAGDADGTAIVGRNSPSTGTVTIDGRWNASRFTAGYRGTADVTLNEDPTVLLQVSRLDIAAEPGSNATVTVNGINSDQGTLDVFNTIHVGGGNNVDGFADDDGGNGTLNIPGGDVRSETAIIGSSDPGSGTATVNISGVGTTRGIWRIEDTISDSNLYVRGATAANLNITDRGILTTDFAYASDLPGTTSNIHVDGHGSELIVAQALYLGGTDATPAGSGNMTVTDQGSVDTPYAKIWDNYNVTVNGGSLTTFTLDLAGNYTQPNDPLIVGSAYDIKTFNLIGGTATAPEIEFPDYTFEGFGTLHGDVVAHHGATATGTLTLGDTDSTTALQINGGPLAVGPHTVTLHQKTFTNINHTTIDGGTLHAPNGLGLTLGAALIGSGNVTARVVAQSGSLIEATGDLTLGDPASFAGYFSDGELQTGPHTVTLNDANQAVLGTLTTLGVTGGSSGGLAAPNGLLLEFGKNIQGHGTIDTPNDPATPLTNLGHIAGNSPAEPITLNGYITGIGSFANVVINGTLSPGLSPGVIDIDGDLTLGNASEIVFELAGLLPGTEHDQVNVAQTLHATGTITVEILDDHIPTLGTTYNLFNFVTATGRFTTINLPTLHPTLTFDTTTLLTTGHLTVVPEPATMLLLVAGPWFATLRHRRRLQKREIETAIMATRTATAVVLTLVAATPALAIDFHWTGGGTDNNWHNPLNWDPGSTSTSYPDASNDAAIFDRLITGYTVDLDFDHDNERIEVRTGHPEIFLFSGDNLHDYTLHTTTEPAAIVSTFPGALFTAQATFQGRTNEFGITRVNASQILQVAVGDHTTKGTLNLNNLIWDSSAAAFIGLNGNGTLNTNTTSIFRSSNGVLGFTAGAVGTANISGSWNNHTGDLIVGKSGTGIVNVDSPGSFVGATAASIIIAEGSSSNGTINMGTGADLFAAGSVYVGGGPSGPGGTGLIRAPNNIFPFADRMDISGDLVVYPNGTVDVALDVGLFVADDIILSPGASFTLQSSTELFVDRITGAPDTFTWNSGHIHADELVVDANAPLGETENLGILEPFDVGTLKVGPTAAGELRIVNNEFTAEVGEVGSLTAGVDPAALTINGPLTDGTFAAGLRVRGTSQATFNLEDGARLEVLGRTRIAGVPGTNAVFNVTNPSTELFTVAGVFVAGNEDMPGGNATVNVTDGAEMEIDGLLKLWPNADMTVDDARLIVTDFMDVLGSLTLTNANLNLSPTSYIDVTGNLHIESSLFKIPQLNITDAGHVTFMNHIVTVDSSGAGNVERLALDGGTITIPVGHIRFESTTLHANGTINAAVVANRGVFANGDLTLGRPDSINAVNIARDYGFTVGPHHVTLHQKNFWDLHPFTFIAGGTLSVPNGTSMSSGTYLAAHGTVNARIAAGFGATIEADGGDLTVGDPTALDGFYSDGIIITGPNTITIVDANQAVLGTLTTLGNAVSPGTLAAPNGLLLEFGKDIQGHGTIDTPNDPATPLTNLGHIQGNSPSEPITLNGYIKGIGSFANVVINGTLAPGLSPGAINIVGDLTLADDATLLMELAGLLPGVGHDQLNVAHTLHAAGTLDVALLGGYHPTLGDTFILLNFASSSGDFTHINLPTLNHGLAFDTSGLLSTGTIAVVPEPAASGVIAITFSLLVSRSRAPAVRRRFSRPPHLQSMETFEA